jgi:DNA-directed RNA polymerase specialized sigma24 family protein
MDVDAEEYFATDWPRLASGLKWMLARAGAPAWDQEDLVQETALRLFRMWPSIDATRPVEPLARRIAANAWTDQWRRRGQREQLGNVPDAATAVDTERAVLARLDVEEVGRALKAMRPVTAQTLRAAVRESEGGGDGTPTSAAVRMARTRARRLLIACVAEPAATAAA